MGVQGNAMYNETKQELFQRSFFLLVFILWKITTSYLDLEL